MNISFLTNLVEVFEKVKDGERPTNSQELLEFCRTQELDDYYTLSEQEEQALRELFMEWKQP